MKFVKLPRHIRLRALWPAVPGLVVALLGLVACAPNVPYRTNLDGWSNAKCDFPVTNADAIAVDTSNPYKLGFVEFDDQGWFWGYRQWSAVKKMILAEGTNNANGLLIVLFVHGWKNNAKFDTTNVVTFRHVLGGLAEDEAARPHPRTVVGVYVGWRGLSARYEPFRTFSFYNRKAAAERIGHNAPTQVFTELEVIQDRLNHLTPANPNPTDGPKTKVILVGHSFGAQLLYSAISQILTERLIRGTSAAVAFDPLETAPTNVFALRTNSIKPLADLVVLVNPAFEASLYYNLFALETSSHIKFAEDQKPLLAIFGSKGDSANRIWFSLGRYLGTRFEKVRSKNENPFCPGAKPPTRNQAEAIVESVGNFDDFITHDLVLTHTNSNSSLATTNLPPGYFQGPTNSNVFHLDARAKYKAGNPFYNVSVDKSIIEDHDDVANPNFLLFLREFIAQYESNEPIRHRLPPR